MSRSGRRRLVSTALGLALTCGLTAFVVTDASGSVPPASNQVTNGPIGPSAVVTPPPAVTVEYLG